MRKEFEACAATGAALRDLPNDTARGAVAAPVLRSRRNFSDLRAMMTGAAAPGRLGSHAHGGLLAGARSQALYRIAPGQQDSEDGTEPWPTGDEGPSRR